MSEVLDLTKKLIARPSVTPDAAGCLEIVAEYLSARGFTCERLDFGEVSNLWATKGEGGPLFCFNGHIDVVPPGPLEAWNTHPFEPVEKEDYLYGRGAADMKAGVAAMVVAAAQVEAAGTVAVLLTSDEEGPSVDGTDAALKTLLDRGVQFDAVLVGESTSEERFGDAIKVGRRGSANGRVVVQGVQGHTAYPHLADNAAHRLAPALAELVSLDWGGPDEYFPATSFQISTIESGTGAYNVVPGQAEARFNLRFTPAWPAEKIRERIEGVLKENGVHEPVEWQFGAYPFLTEPGALVNALEDAIKEGLGCSPKRSTGGGTSDARFFAAHGIRVVEFGPLNKTIHAANECVEIACLEPLVRIYGATAREVLSKPVS